jgi:hypothetical protein
VSGWKFAGHDIRFIIRFGSVCKKPWKVTEEGTNQGEGEPLRKDF